MRKVFLILFVLGIFLVGFVPVTATENVSNATKDSYNSTKVIEDFNSYVESVFSHAGIPAAAIVIVKDGKIMYLKCLGVKDVITKAPVDENTLFGIGSATKQFAATNIAQLVSQGLMSWDDPITKYYNDTSEFQLYDSNVTNGITIRDCLSHRSGLPNYSGDSNWAIFNYSYPYDRHQLRYIENNTEFRSTWQYHNILYALPSYCAVRATNITWSELMKKELLGPLGMKTATTNYTDFMNSPNHVTPYYLLYNGTLKQFDINLDPVGPAGSMACSISEMANWLKFQIANTGQYNGVQIVSKEELNETHTGQIKIPTIYSQYGSTYGFGWFIADDNINHGGDTWAFHSMIRIYQSKGLGIAIFTNGGPYAKAFRSTLDFKFKDLLNGNNTTDPWPYWKNKNGDSTLQPALDPPTSPIVPPLQFSSYIGAYSSAFSGNITIITKNNTLICYYGNNSEPYDLTHWNGNVFIEPTHNVPLNFTDVYNGTAHQLIVPFTSEYNTTLSNPDVFKRAK